MPPEWTDVISAGASSVSAIATTVAAIAAWRAFRVYEKMHASQETEIQRVAPNLKIAVNFKNMLVTGFPERNTV